MKRLIKNILREPLFLFKLIYLLGVVLYYKIQAKKIIVFNLKHSYFFSIFEIIYEKLLHTNNIIIFFAYAKQNKALKLFLKNKIHNKYLIPNTLSPYLPFDMFLCSEIIDPDFPVSLLKTKKVQMYHGIGTHNHYNKKDVLRRFDIYFSVGPQLNKAIEDFNNEAPKQNYKIYNIGYAKTDVLVKEAKKCKAKKEKEKETLTVLYAPHFNYASSLHRFQEALMVLVAQQGFNLLIKPHNYLFTKYKEQNWLERFLALQAQHANITYINDPDTQKQYAKVDLLIADAGTTEAFEFSIYQKPVLLYGDFAWFKGDNERVEAELALKKAAFEFFSLDELKEYLVRIKGKDEKMLAEIDQKSLVQKELVERYFYNLGSATEEAIKAIQNEIK
jgi:hypothetical protein